MIARPAPRRLVPTSGALVVVLAAVLALAGCDLRFESAPPAAPTPGAAEQVRERTVADALALAAAARSAQPIADKAAAAVLADVATFSTAHADQLGGVYQAGLATPTSTTSPAAVVATPDQVLAALRTDASTALADATTAADGATARLLAAVGVSRAALGTRLATALNEPAPAPTPTPTAPAVPVPTASPAAALTAADVAPLVLAHDQAGFGLEVVAAKLTGGDRTAAATSAAAHRDAAEQWAQRVKIAGTASDPRRADYALPKTIDDPAGARTVAASLEAGVAEAASAAILGAPQGARQDLIDELTRADAAAARWGAAATPFPGLPGLA
ncbi:MAG: hypothetical protein BGO37_13055 [Cellulomonas sp. 73-92]|uniref:DUF4439 domain-containing protein n=1 Tax=Cellulomonas sp. 73-92 TaxID=1895740 RepID=UPI00092A818D|nr:DUF4439 domain-containing protein [Cellulomonas sp. 73-92]OJV82901.1 MAG: hypothetical protein BGO37_13055 [Cellulomonas sp. 73-92]